MALLSLLATVYLLPCYLLPTTSFFTGLCLLASDLWPLFFTGLWPLICRLMLSVCQLDAARILSASLACFLFHKILPFAG